MTDQSSKPLSTNLANVWSFLTEAIKSPVIAAVVAALISLPAGAVGLKGWQIVTSTPGKLSIDAADKPNAEAPPPVRVVVETLDSIKAELSALSAKVDKVLEKLPEPKVISPKVGKTKSAGVGRVAR